MDVSIRELMIPLAEYATISQEASLTEAIGALEAAQAQFDVTRYRHRAILALDDEGKVVGKLTQMDTVRAVDPHYIEKLDEVSLGRFGISSEYVERVLAQNEIHAMSLQDRCRGLGRLSVADIMHAPVEGEYIDIESSMRETVQRFVSTGQHSLLVTQDEDIIGVLRLTDVFSAVCQIVKSVTEE
jgi:CBS-domain-containing membrane protein